MQHKVKRVYLPRIKIFATAILAALFVIIATKAVVWGIHFRQQTGLSPGVILRLLLDNGAKLAEADGRTNILVLGIAGGTHDGADLTDTIMVLSPNWSRHSMGLISVPRDIWSNTLKDKVNSAYHYGEEKKKGGGIVLAKAIIEDVIGIPVHYGLVIDFSGFRNVIDLVGGIPVNVTSGFVDLEFPIAGREDDLCSGDPQLACRYEVLRFEAGRQTMDGERALKYVRSRHAEGDEGSDFARSRRQQDVLLALKTKLVDPRVWLFQHPFILYRALDNATHTDMNIGELMTVGKLLVAIPEVQIHKVSIEPLLTNPPLWLYGRYVLVPKEDFAAIHAFINSGLK